MALIETTEPVPATTRTVRSVKCDGCGKVNDPGRGHEWGNGRFRSTEVVVNIKHIESLPDCGSSEAAVWDFCPECFEEKAQPLLETLAKPREETSDW